MYSREIAESLARKHGWHIAKDGRGWRRVVPSPLPERILETETIQELLGSGVLVIFAGGGGVPATADNDTAALSGAEAVVDKDLTAALLAELLKADFLLILTDVPCVYAGYGTHDPQPVLDAAPTTCAAEATPTAPWAPRRRPPPDSSNAPEHWPPSAPSTRRTRSSAGGRGPLCALT